MSTKDLARKLDRMIDQIERRRQCQEPPVIRTCWGHETIDDEPGVIVIKTSWRTVKLENERDNE